MGVFELELHYSGCSGFTTVTNSKGEEEREAIVLELKYTVHVKNNTVTKIFFNGTDLALEGYAPNDTVTLEDISRKLINLEKKLSE